MSERKSGRPPRVMSTAKINVYAILTTTPPPTVPRRKAGTFAYAGWRIG